MEQDYFKEERYIMAQKKVKAIKGFYAHLFWYFIINGFLWVSIYLNLDTNESFFQYEHFFTAFFWGIGVLFHWFGTFGKNIFFSKEWEERKIKEYLEQDNFDNFNQ